MSEVVIVGGGLAGGAAAALLAREGTRVVVLERETGPRDKICGEFLSTEAQAHLAALGLDPSRLGGARIDWVRLVAGERSAQARLPFTALGLTRRRLDEALLVHAEALGACVERGVTARSVSPGLVHTSGGDLAAPKLLLASGKHDVKGARRRTDGAIKGMVGFKSYFRLATPMQGALAGFVEVVLFDGGYAGLQLVEDGVANLCLLASHQRFEAAGRTWPALLTALMAEPHLARRLSDAEELSTRPLTIADVPYGFLHGFEDEPDGPYRLGDQAAVIPSFSGDGMSIALHSARLAARAVAEGAGAGAYHRALFADIARPVRFATWLQRRMDAWPGRRAIVGGLGIWPGGLGLLASWTRVPAPALRRAGMGRKKGSESFSPSAGVPGAAVARK